MIVLVVFAFLAGIVTILSPCILPLLPIILSASVDTGKRRPVGIVVGFVLSFTFFTLFLTTLVKLSGIPADSLRLISVAVLVTFGLSLFVPKIQLVTEQLFTKLARLAPNTQTKHGFIGGLLVGVSLGLLWTPCVGPILASVISLALTGTVTAQAGLITFAYALGTAIPMFLIMHAGTTALQKIPWLVKNTAKIQKTFGVLMVLTAIGILLNIDRRFQTFILNAFPNYGVGLTQFEDNTAVKQELEKINEQLMDETVIGKPMSDLTLPKGPVAPEIIPGGAWFNSEPLTIASLKGKVVLVDFWTYTCINCQRTFPYLRTWWNTYKDKGLVIIGVHAPEFEFEKSEANVASAIRDFDLTYPIVQDNNFATWRAYQNNYWPAKYLIDKDGLVRYTHFGEGDYDATERMIQELLQETGSPVSGEIKNPEYEIYAKTPESYLGYSRLTQLDAQQKLVIETISHYSFPPRYQAQDTFVLDGDWFFSKEYANPQSGAKLDFDFESKEVFLVMRTKGNPARLKIYIDDQLQFFGDDNDNGLVTVDTDRLYKLINLPTPGRHLLRLEFLDNNCEIYAFTFG